MGRGETCTAGVCGGGSPVAPCVNLSGEWFEHREIGFVGTDTHRTIVQKGTILELVTVPESGPYEFSYGNIDPATGVFAATTSEFCPGSVLAELTVPESSGVAALDGRS